MTINSRSPNPGSIPDPPEALGRRLAHLRAEAGLTQQDVATRLALSRNAVSHVETGLSHPSERTVVLLAGLFRVEPHDLVAGTDYPRAKADRLPLVAPRYTEVDARLKVLEAELRLLERLPEPDAALARAEILDDLHRLERRSIDPSERLSLTEGILYLLASDSRNAS